MGNLDYYVIYGKIVKDETPQTSENVTVRNETQSEEHTVQTDAEGKYSVTITRTDWYPSGCDKDDSIKVTSLGASWTTTADTDSYPWGRKVHIDLTTKNLAETVSVSDTVSTLGSFNKLLSENVPLATDILKKMGIKTFSEQLNIADGLLQFTTKRLIETVGVSDNLFATKFFDVFLCEDIELGVDIFARGETFTEQLNIADALLQFTTRKLIETLLIDDVLHKPSTKELTETLSMDDALLKFTIKSPMEESLTVSDSVAFLKTLHKLLTESVELSDNVLTELSSYRSFTEQLSVIDTLTNIWAFVKTLTDSVTIGDSVANELLVVVKVLTESLTVADTLKHKVETDLAETQTIADMLGRKLWIYRTFTEVINLATDIIEIKQSVGLAETLTISDSLSFLKAQFKTFSETLTLTGKILRVLQKKPLQETLNISDAVTKKLYLKINEILYIIDTLQKIYISGGAVPVFIESELTVFSPVKVDLSTFNPVDVTLMVVNEK